ASRKAQSCAGCPPWAQHLRQGNIIIITSRYAPSSYNRCEHESQKLHFSNHEGSMMTHTHTHTHTPTHTHTHRHTHTHTHTTHSHSLGNTSSRAQPHLIQPDTHTQTHTHTQTREHKNAHKRTSRDRRGRTHNIERHDETR